jgi:hypothetical protein
LKTDWLIEKGDTDRIRALIEEQRGNPFVRRRIEKNVSKNKPLEFRRERLWEVMLMCLLTTQQRAGPNSAVTRFCSTSPFPLGLEDCSSHGNRLSHFLEKTLTKFGGLRRARTIGKEAEHNLKWLNENGWNEIHTIADELSALRKEKPNNKCIPVERRAANFISENLKGFGPKQSRNLWQTLGLSRFEIPIDSRITKWLNRKGFPLQLSAGALSDVNYYEFVMRGIQKLCENCEVLPCILDAAIFADFDQDWPEEKLIW